MAWPERLIPALFVVSAAAAALSPTPLLQTLSPSTENRIFPSKTDQDVTAFELPREMGAARVERDSRFGCLRLRAPTGISVGPVCNPHISCRDKTTTASNVSAFEVFKLPASNAFYAETGSTCNSNCCDWRGMSFTGDGERLDDGVLQRLWLRLGIAGLASIVIGILCLGWSLQKRAGIRARLGLIVTLGFGIGMLWWNY